jgi:hypothetical protein
VLRRPLEPGQYLAIRYTDRLAEAGVVPSVGSRGDSYDNALAESFNGLYKAELIRHTGPWRGLDDVEYATLEYVDWFNHRRLHGALGMIPPAQFEATFVHQPATPLPASSQEHESPGNIQYVGVRRPGLTSYETDPMAVSCPRRVDPTGAHRSRCGRSEAT